MQAILNRQADETVVLATTTYAQLTYLHEMLANSPSIADQLCEAEFISRISGIAGAVERQLALMKGAGMKVLQTTKMFSRGMHFTPDVMRIFVIGLLGALAELKQLLERGARQPNARAPATVSLRHGELRRATKQIEKQLTTLKKSNRNDELLAHQIAVLEEQLRIGETFATICWPRLHCHESSGRARVISSTYRSLAVT